jgi:hypothetical protein
MHGVDPIEPHDFAAVLLSSLPFIRNLTDRLDRSYKYPCTVIKTIEAWEFWVVFFDFLASSTIVVFRF